MSQPVQLLVERVHGSRNGKGWIAKCPAQSDCTPILSIDEERGQARCERRMMTARGHFTISEFAPFRGKHRCGPRQSRHLNTGRTKRKNENKQNMKLNQIYPSKYLNAADLSREGEDVTIRKVTIEEVGEERQRKPVIAFDERKRQLVVNKTNWNSIVEITGEEDSDNWPGYKIKLVRARVSFGTKNVEAIRVELADPVKPVHTLPKPHSVAATLTECDDDTVGVPF